MRPCVYLCVVLLAIVVCGGLLTSAITSKRARSVSGWVEAGEAVRVLGLSDLAVSTEARYTRHPAVSDPLVPFMDHPGGMEHFPSGSFFTPVR